VSYNVFKTEVNTSNPVPAGLSYGFIGNVTGVTMIDSNITADFSLGPPITQNPFAFGASVVGTAVTVAGSYTTYPVFAFDNSPNGVTATGLAILSVISVAIVNGQSAYSVNDLLTFAGGVVLKVTSIGAFGVITGVSIVSTGSQTGSLPANPITQLSGPGTPGHYATFTFTWGVTGIVVSNAGSGYTGAPAITFSAGAAAATATIGPLSGSNPSVPVFFQQRLGLAAPPVNPQTVYLSQPGAYYNFNISNPIQDDDAITASIVSGQLNNIKAMIPQPGGLIVLTDGGSFLINGGSLGSAVTPASITANAQSFLGCNDMPPIVVNYDILYVQSKGSSVRDASYNFYANVFTGADISVLSSHLFFGHKLLEWAWAEEPYKIVWAVRDDGILLSLTFIKEQEFIGWAHHDTYTNPDTRSLFKSICTIVEAASIGFQNFVYLAVQRSVGGQTVQYIEQMTERATTGLVKDYWTVDCGLQYNGGAVTTFLGAQHLVGLHCTGLADGVIIPDFIMPATGTFVLGTAAAKVTVGLAYTPDLQTLYIDMGQPTIQSKDKKIPAVTLRVTETLGLKIGSALANLVDMKDLVRGNVGQNTNVVVTDLVTGDAKTTIDPKWQEAGQIFIRQPYPYPASILGVMQDLVVGDTAK
jgi:hypothetical protein